MKAIPTYTQAFPKGAWNYLPGQKELLKTAKK